VYVCSSYRDPLTTQTFEAFRQSLDQSVSAQEIEYSAVSIIGRELKPLTPLLFCNEAFRRYLYNMTDQVYQSRRRRLFEATPSDLAKAASRIARCMDSMHSDATVCSRATAKGLGGKVIELPD